MKRIKEHLTGAAAALTSTAVLLAAEAGVNIPMPLAVAVVFIACVIVSALWPRWAEARGLLTLGHPAAFTAALALLLVYGGALIGWDIERAEAVTIVGGLTILVSIGTPRVV